LIKINILCTDESEFNSKSGVFLQAFLTGAESGMGKRVTLFEDADEEAIAAAGG
jgi:hypothetical protein